MMDTTAPGFITKDQPGPTPLRRLFPQTIAAKLGFIAILASATMIALGALLIYTVISLNHSLETITLYNEEAQRVENLFRDMQDTADDLSAIIDDDRVDLIPSVLADNETLLSDFAAYRSTADTFNLTSDINFITENESLFNTIRGDLFQAVTHYRDGGDIQVTQEIRESVDRNIQHLAAGLERAAGQRALLLGRELEQARNLQSNLSIVTLVIMATGTTILGLAIYVITRSITRNLDRLSAMAAKFTKGDYTGRVHVQTQDELQQLARSFNVMAEAIEYRDIETQAARQRAERSDQVKSAFLASMSHELRTPLNAIINFSKFVAQGDLGPVNEGQEETLFEVVDSANHLLSLINDVLDMSKIDSGTLNLFIEDNINFVDILGRVVTTGQGLIGDKPVEIRTEIASDLPLVRGDKQRLFQVFLNVMSNATKFTEEGYITLKAERISDRDEIQVTITDTGMGISPDEMDNVFISFKQTGSGLRQGGGTGLGMPISKNLVEAHGGRLWLESQPEVGTTVFVVLPVKSEDLIPTLTS